MPHLAAVDRYDCAIANSARPSRVRQQPPELCCCTLTGLTDLCRLVVRELRHGKVSNESEDQVLVVAEPGAPPVSRHGRRGYACAAGWRPGHSGGERPVTVQQAARTSASRRSFPAPRAWQASAIGLQQQVRHGRGPALLGQLEVVDVFKITKQVGSAPGVQRAGQMREFSRRTRHASARRCIRAAPKASMSPADRPATCRQVRSRVPATCTYVRLFAAQGGGLVGVQRRGGAQQRPDVLHERRQRGGGAAADPGHPPGWRP